LANRAVAKSRRIAAAVVKSIVRNDPVTTRLLYGPQNATMALIAEPTNRARQGLT
jgi:hypothetical protein